jgi:hypothetical protein
VVHYNWCVESCRQFSNKNVSREETCGLRRTRSALSFPARRPCPTTPPPTHRSRGQDQSEPVLGRPGGILRDAHLQLPPPAPPRHQGGGRQFTQREPGERTEDGKAAAAGGGGGGSEGEKAGVTDSLKTTLWSRLTLTHRTIYPYYGVHNYDILYVHCTV